MKNPYESETGCCPRFDPEPWDETEHTWDGKLFIKDRVRCFLYMPLRFGAAMVRNMEKIEKADAFTPHVPLVLSDHTSRWNMDLYIEAAHQVPDAENTRLDGTYLSKVFEGPYKDTGKWCTHMAEWMQSQQKQVKKQMMYYTTCPRCAKEYGKNYVVIFAQI